MAYKIIYKKRFLNKLQSLLVYLEKDWGSKTANEFLSIIDSRIDALREYPHIGAPVGKEDIRALHITKHNRLFYRIDKNSIILLNLYDTRKE